MLITKSYYSHALVCGSVYHGTKYTSPPATSRAPLRDDDGRRTAKQRDGRRTTDDETTGRTTDDENDDDGRTTI